jgi:hypothetical protein
LLEVRPLGIVVAALEKRRRTVFEAVYPYPAISGTRQRVRMLAGKGRFQLTGVLRDVEQVFSGPQ